MSAVPSLWREPRRPWRRRVYARCGQLRRLGRCPATRLDPQWLALLDAENVQTVILDRREDRDLLRLLYHSPQWAVDFADRQSVIMVRRAAASVVELSYRNPLKQFPARAGL